MIVCAVTVTVASGSCPEGPDGSGVNGLTLGPLRLMGRQGRGDTGAFRIDAFPAQHQGECLMKSGASGESRVAHGGSGRVPADVFPTTVSAESFEETDTARNPRIREEAWPQGVCWDRMGATELVGDVGVSS